MNFILSLHQHIIDKLNEKVPPDEHLADLLSRILRLNKPAIYRRIEGKVAFTFKEMSIISKEMGLSLDELIGSLPRNSTLLNMIYHNHLNMEENNHKMLQIYLDALKYLKHVPDSQVEEVSNLLPTTFYIPYKSITRFMYFKWAYQYGNQDRPLPYKDIQINDKYREAQLNFTKEIQTASRTSLILDPLVFYYNINDLKYFRDINLITREELLVIQKDLCAMLEDMEWSCHNGIFKSSGKPILLYIAIINFDTNYCYIHANNLYISLIRAFLLNDLSTTSQKTFAQIQKWIQSLKRYATLITQSAEKQKIIYFDYQRKIVESLTNDKIRTFEFLFDLDHFRV